MIPGTLRDDCERCGHVFTVEEIETFRAWCARVGLPWRAIKFCKPCSVEMSRQKAQRVGAEQFWSDALDDLRRAKEQK